MTVMPLSRAHSQDIRVYKERSHSGSSTSTSDLLTLGGVSGEDLSRPRPTTVDLSSLYGEVTSLPMANVTDFLTTNVCWAFAPQPRQLVNVYLSKAKSPSPVSFDVSITGEQVVIVFIPEPRIQKEVSATVELATMPRSWIELASGAFSGSRNMTSDEIAEFNALRAPLTKPLSKPLKKLPPR